MQLHVHGKKIKVLNLNCCCTISVVLMKCVGYVVWTLTYNDSLAQIRNTTAEIRNFFLQGGCFYWRTRRRRQSSQHKPGQTYSNVVDAAIDATNLVCHHATPPSPSQLETFPFPQILPTTDFPAHYWLTEHVDFGFILVFRSHFFRFFLVPCARLNGQTVSIERRLRIHKVKWRHRIYGHDTIAILWV